MEVKINYNKNNVELVFNITKNTLYYGVENTDVIRFLKGVFTNKTRFESRFINEFKGVKHTMKRMLEAGELDNYDQVDLNDWECDAQMDELLAIYDDVKPFSYAEAFKIEDEEFKIMVFGSIDIEEMIEELGHTRIKTEGKKVNHKTFNRNGEFTGMKEYDTIYETHEVDGTKLGLEENIFALRCWCTTTDKEHWLWIEDQFKDQPLEAVASLCRVHEDLIPNIKEIKRQGDILLIEMKEDVEATGEIVPLNADQYFSLLTAQS